MTEAQADVQAALDVVGWANADFYYYWINYVANGLPWDGQSCSEIACCISYFGGNLSRIYVSNYAEGLVNLYRAHNRFDNTPQLGDFIFFTYGSGLPEHTGRVVDISNGIITTVEGNVLTYVAQFYYPVDSPYIYGYGHPDYSDSPVPTPPTPTPGGNQGKYNRKRRRRHEIFY